MTTARNLPILVCLVLSSFTGAVAQEKVLWQGSVAPQHIAVYESSSTRGRITTTLAHDDIVDVILQTTISGDEWCRVSLAGASEPLGFVLCLNLRKGHITPKQNPHLAPAAAQSLQVASASRPPQAPSASTVLTNKEVLDLHKAGLSEDALVAKIKSSQCNFDTSSTQLRQLNEAGLADAVIVAMVEASEMQAPILGTMVPRAHHP